MKKQRKRVMIIRSDYYSRQGFEDALREIIFDENPLKLAENVVYRVHG